MTSSTVVSYKNVVHSKGVVGNPSAFSIETVQKAEKHKAVNKLAEKIFCVFGMAENLSFNYITTFDNTYNFTVNKVSNESLIKLLKDKYDCNAIEREIKGKQLKKWVTIPYSEIGKLLIVK